MIHIVSAAVRRACGDIDSNAVYEAAIEFLDFLNPQFNDMTEFAFLLGVSREELEGIIEVYYPNYSRNECSCI